MNKSKSKDISKELAEEISKTMFESEEIMVGDDFSSFTVLLNNPELRRYYSDLDEKE